MPAFSRKVAMEASRVRSLLTWRSSSQKSSRVRLRSDSRWHRRQVVTWRLLPCAGRIQAREISLRGECPSSGNSYGIPWCLPPYSWPALPGSGGHCTSCLNSRAGEGPVPSWC